MTVDFLFRRLALAPRMSAVGAVVLGVLLGLFGVALRLVLTHMFTGLGGFVLLIPGVLLASLCAGRAGGYSALGAGVAGIWAAAEWALPEGSIQRQAILAGLVSILPIGVFCVELAASLRRSLRTVDQTLQALQAKDADAYAAQAELHAMVDQASAGIAKVALDGKVETANARFAELLGLSVDDTVGTTTPGVTHPDDVAPTLAALEASRAGREGRLEKRYIRPDGAVVWALLSLRALRDKAGVVTGHIAVIIDITAAKAAEAALRESESRFRMMADSAPSPVWMTDADGRVEFVNEALRQFYQRTAADLMGHGWKESVHPDDRADVAEAMSARETRRSYGFEARFRRHDGEWRWARVAVNPRFAADGTFLGYVGMSFDTTDTRQAMQAAATQQTRQRLLLDLTDRLRDAETLQQIAEAAALCAAQAFDADEATFGELSPDGDRITVRGDWRRPGRQALPALQVRVEDYGDGMVALMRQGRAILIPDVEADPRTAPKADSWRAAGVRASALAPIGRGGRTRALLGVGLAEPRAFTDDEALLLEDIAARASAEIERTRAEAAIRESEARFRDIADTAPVLIWVTNADRSRAFVNQAYVAYNGGTYEEARDRDWREVIHPDDHADLITASVTGEATGQPFSLEARYLRHDGVYRWLKSFSRPRLGLDGEVIGFVGVAFDVSDIRTAQHELQRINDMLEERVSAALAEKAQAEADLMHAQRMEAVGRLTGGVAHDFNNLLTVVIGALDLILKSPDNAARRQKLGEAALAAARRGEGLTHQLLAFSRRQALRPQLTDLNALIRQGEPLFRKGVGENVEFRLKLQKGGARVNVDPAQFEAALLNLIVNARDAMPDGGRVTVSTSSCAIAAGEHPEMAAGDYVCVTVSDTGQGMSPDLAMRVFEPFFTTKAVGKGTGLGLSQVYGFARQSGGGCQIASAEGKGTDIRVYLPPATGADVEVGAAGEPEQPLAGGRILLVEDDAGVAAIAVELLEGLGLSVTTAVTAPEALERLAADSFDMMLSDIVMPGGMTGIELARRAAIDHPEMRIVLTSGYAGEDVDAALSDAPWPFLRKPYSGEQVAAVLAHGRTA